MGEELDLLFGLQSLVESGEWQRLESWLMPVPSYLHLTIPISDCVFLASRSLNCEWLNLYGPESTVLRGYQSALENNCWT